MADLATAVWPADRSVPVLDLRSAGDRVAVWANNIPEWVNLGLAGDISAALIGKYVTDRRRLQLL